MWVAQLHERDKMISIRTGYKTINEKQTSMQHPYNRTIRVSQLEIIDNINDTHRTAYNRYMHIHAKILREIFSEETRRIWRIWRGSFLSAACHFFLPLPLEEKLLHAHCFRSNNPRRWETSFIAAFRILILVRDIRESSLIVFKRDTLAGVSHGQRRGHACTSRGGENIYRGAGRSSGWRATVRVSDQLTICRRTHGGWFEPPVIRQKIWTREQWDLGPGYENNGPCFVRVSTHQRYPPLTCVQAASSGRWFLVEIESE